jgi:hypothetical protein
MAKEKKGPTMKTRKHRKWYQLSGMKRHGKFEGVIESPFAIFHIGQQGKVTVVATGPCVVLCRGHGLAVSKDVARLTAGLSLARLYVMAVAPESVEEVRQSLASRYADMGDLSYRFTQVRKLDTL